MNATVVSGDISTDLATTLARAAVVAVDTETSGLHWREDRLLLCQLYTESTGPVLLRDVIDTPTNLARVLGAHDVLKVFHFAPFDIRFIEAQWRTPIANVACTKAASKLLDQQLSSPEHSLTRLVERNLGVSLDKGAVRTSDWGASTLTDEQVAYAVADVVHLPALLDILVRRLKSTGDFETWRTVCEYMETDARLEIRGVPNPLEY